MAFLVYVLDVDAIETTGFNWVDQFNITDAQLDAWFDKQVAQYPGRPIRVRLISMVVDLPPHDTEAIAAELEGARDLMRITPAIRTYEHPAWFNAVRAFNIAQAGNGSDVD